MREDEIPVVHIEGARRDRKSVFHGQVDAVFALSKGVGEVTKIPHLWVKRFAAKARMPAQGHVEAFGASGHEREAHVKSA